MVKDTPKIQFLTKLVQNYGIFNIRQLPITINVFSLKQIARNKIRSILIKNSNEYAIFKKSIDSLKEYGIPQILIYYLNFDETYNIFKNV
jgi:phage antirepressor YoqD-like protein